MIDLHIHSNYSDDGEFSVNEILNLCKEKQIEYMSITDHNSVKGISEALTLATKQNIQMISGVELDCVYKNHNFHLLGYHFDYTNCAFDEIEQNIVKQELEAAEKKIELIQKELGISISTKEVLDFSNGGIVTGELIAEILLKKEDANKCEALSPYLPNGNRCDNPYVNFYWDYFSQGKPAYVPIKYISLNDAVDLIHSTGGIAVLAHPAQNLKNNFEFINEIVNTGIDGIEVYSSYHSKADIDYFANVAQKNNLLVTCGSDFHGKTKPSISLCGHRADENIANILEALKNLGIFL